MYKKLKKCLFCGNTLVGKQTKFCCKKCSTKQWKIDNTEKYKQYSKAWNQKNKDKIKQWNRKWRTNNLEKIKEFRETNRAYFNEKSLDSWWKKKYGIKRSEIVKKLGTKNCFVCNSPDKLRVHHKDGNADNKKIENFILLCSTCHLLIHEASKRKINFTILKELVENLKYGRA